MSNKKTKLFIIIGCFLLTTISLTFAYFVTNVSGNSSAKSNVVTAADLEISYGDSSSTFSASGIVPGFSKEKWLVVNNTGTVTANYNLEIANVTNTFVNTNDLTYTITRYTRKMNWYNDAISYTSQTISHLGVVVNVTNRLLSDYQLIAPSKSYRLIISNYNLTVYTSFFDENYQYISQVETASFTTPRNARYYRISFETPDGGTMNGYNILLSGNSNTSFTPFDGATTVIGTNAFPTAASVVASNIELDTTTYHLYKIVADYNETDANQTGDMNQSISSQFIITAART